MYLLKRHTLLGSQTCPTIQHIHLSPDLQRARPSKPCSNAAVFVNTAMLRLPTRRSTRFCKPPFARQHRPIFSRPVITVRDPETKQKLSVPAGNQKHIVDCPVFLAFCADLTRLEHVLQERGHTLEDNNLEIGLVSSIDASLVGMSAYLAADSLGIKGVMIGAVRNDAVKSPKFWNTKICLLRLQHMSWLSAALPQQKPRMDQNFTVHREKFQPEKIAPSVEAYDPRSVRITIDRQGRRRIHGATTWIRNSIRSCVMAFASN